MDCIDEGFHSFWAHVRINAVTEVSNVAPSTKLLHHLDSTGSYILLERERGEGRERERGHGWNTIH